MDLPKLISEAKQGSNAAQQLIFERLSPRAKILCLRYVKNNEDAEEVMVDGFYKFFKALKKFTYISDAGLYAYVKRIMVNECLTLLRKTNSFIMVSDNLIAEMPLEDHSLDTMQSTEIYELVLQLPVGYRTIFNLFAIEGYVHKEIAVVLGIKESASRSQLTRARLLLQKMLISKRKVYGKDESEGRT